MQVFKYTSTISASASLPGNRVTTVLDATGILLIAAGVAALLGLPAGAIVLGAFALAVSWRMTRDPASVPGWLARRRART